MAEQDLIYPGYGFSSHSGYGVAKHRAAIEELGVTPLHRLSFTPLAKYSGVVVANGVEKAIDTVTTRQVGNVSEEAAAAELVRRGHEIIERNWKTKWCEIDIVSKKDDTIYFTEVKHRRNDRSGDGLAAITPRKLRQMKFAAELYAMNHPGLSLRLVVVATTGDPPEIMEYLELS